jgi:NADH dehydrogenase
VFPLAGANARFQPVYVGDVVQAFATALDDDGTYRATLSTVRPEGLRVA